MLSAGKLAGIAITGVGVAGGIAGINYALTPEKATLKQLIISAKRTPLEKTAKTWEIKLFTYNNSVKTSSHFRLTKEDATSLSEWCELALTKKVEVAKKDSSDYPIALRLCTKPTNEEKLKKNSKTPLTNSGWDKKVQTYKAEAKDELIISTISNKDDASEELIKSWCEDNLNKEIEDDEKTYKLMDKWCANP